MYSLHLLGTLYSYIPTDKAVNEREYHHKFDFKQKADLLWQINVDNCNNYCIIIRTKKL